jgi:hypothetical protein
MSKPQKKLNPQQQGAYASGGPGASTASSGKKLKPKSTLMGDYKKKKAKEAARKKKKSAKKSKAKTSKGKSVTKGGGRRSRRCRCRRRRQRGGQGVQSLVHRALLPAALYYLQKQQQQRTGRRARGGKYRKGSPSKTRKGRLDFITHLGSDVYDEAGHFVRKAVKPYTRRRRHR